MAQDSTVIYTVGHSNLAKEAFLDLLQPRRIERLVDVRARPASRFAPWSNKKALPGFLAAHGIEYFYLGHVLGGLPRGQWPDRPLTRDDFKEKSESVEFREGLRELLLLAREKRTAIMCAEEDPAHCHRRLLITPALLEQGLRVFHIRKGGGEEYESDLFHG